MPRSDQADLDLHRAVEGHLTAHHLLLLLVSVETLRP
jgi:hypothetical protein